jgi:Asp-tRNA(Asn)/Glu-tRNA(Gln) amidotransferase C subunit
MTNSKNELDNLLDLLKMQVEDKEKLQKDFDSILSMFNDVQKASDLSESETLEKRKISINDLREDKAINADFRKDLRGKYMKVPKVIKN